MDKILKQYLPPIIYRKLSNFGTNPAEKILEIRLRVQRPVEVITTEDSYFLDTNISARQLEKCLLLLADNSLYALERQLKQGFITINGGHRVGFTGQAVCSRGKVQSLKHINSLNIRLTREIIGISGRVIEMIYNRQQKNIENTLIISPPGAGKTTLLRDLVRFLSDGSAEYQIRGLKVGVVDERSEIGGAYQGVPRNRIGKRTDLLDNCPKAEGMMMLIRSMSPEIIAVDELGRREDVVALQEAINAGVRLLSTAHGPDLQSLKMRPLLQDIIKSRVFSRYIILDCSQGPGTVTRILDNRGGELYRNVD